jgi:hypothetical protein
VSEPKPLAPDAVEFMARLERQRVTHEAWASSPEGRRALGERARVAAEAEARRRSDELLDTADRAQIPDEFGVRAVALDDAPPLTEPLAAYREALAWRGPRPTRRGRGRRPLIRVVAGPPGTGKSCALAWCVVRHDGGARYVTAATVAATPRNGWSTNEERWQDWLTVDLLAIDELGCEKGDPAAVTYLLAERYNAGLATLGAGNINRTDFQARYKEGRLADRLINGQEADGGLPWYVGSRGESLRNPEHRAALQRGER